VKALYFDCFSGISGDMTLSALLGLGVPIEHVREQVGAVVPGEVTLSTARVSLNGIGALRTTVGRRDSAPPQPRDYAAIAAAISEAPPPMKPEVKETALSIFRVLAVAESKIHGTTPERVHFHEVGAWDSIADIVGVAAALSYLEVDAVFASPVPVGSGFVESAHGVIPVPAPATSEILTGIPVRGTGLEAELTTPTGAAILKATVQAFGPLPRMTVDRVGWGAGHRPLPGRPNLLRAFIGELEADDQRDSEWLVETNIDDSTPEVLAHAQSLLLERGALDVWMTPIHMKKNRPGIQLSLLCRPDDLPLLRRLVLRETTAIGLRERPVARTTLDRKLVTVRTHLGEARVKVARMDGDVVNVAPEFEDARKLAVRLGLPVKEVMAVVMAEAAKLIESERSS